MALHRGRPSKPIHQHGLRPADQPPVPEGPCTPPGPPVYGQAGGGPSQRPPFSPDQRPFPRPGPRAESRTAGQPSRCSLAGYSGHRRLRPPTARSVKLTSRRRVHQPGSRRGGAPAPPTRALAPPVERVTTAPAPPPLVSAARRTVCGRPRPRLRGFAVLSPFPACAAESGRWPFGLSPRQLRPQKGSAERNLAPRVQSRDSEYCKFLASTSDARADFSVNWGRGKAALGFLSLL
ncbi:39S ribosomal protein L55, mitochondrial isoform X1 [Marmota marmota marmota]|uniref:39S ribosomal protein L55, mitochondrial isoform X1 n=1 Tax=Marmota marmota marmota TaxID=9994 RepID=UPI00076282ED|nr:39S ribosomal protein L55, mitochondrial isoform X1 [Marmota marmota marmota]